VIVLSSAYDAFLDRLVEATKSLKVGPADDPGTSVGPVIDEEAYERIMEYIEIGKEEATLALESPAGKKGNAGYFIGPHIFTNVDPNSKLAQEEIFGPVLAVISSAQA
jgi:RHH-type proline utilization regulon transcriptional repressor/proline dehydrogenase/delta 1-pyrroline-5-carboxylate dehydrogenase